MNLFNLSEHAEKTAIICNGEKITYSQLNLLVEDAIKYIYRNNIEGAKMVTIFIPRSKECISMILALFRLNIPFLLLPIDTPKERKNYMIHDSCSEYVVEYNNEQYITTVIDTKKSFEYSQAALILYTSGSGGHPKGVVIARRAFQHFIKAADEVLLYQEEMEIHLASAPFSFDSYLLELLLPLALGKTVVLSNDIESKNPRALGQLILKYEVDSILITPTKMIWLLESNKQYNLFNSVRTIVLGGEHVKKALIDRIRKNYNGRIVNIYGPTEATVFVTYKYINNSDDISIGNVLPGNEILILNEQMQASHEGEICISGSSLASGYIHKELNKNNFVNYFGRTIYKTGDMGGFYNNELQIIGRKDRQIKINGCRIELDELENLILSVAKIQNCAVSYKEKIKQVWVYYEAQETIGNIDWYSMLKQYIPNYMMPQKFIKVDMIQQNQSGKVDHYFYDQLE